MMNILITLIVKDEVLGTVYLIISNYRINCIFFKKKVENYLCNITMIFCYLTTNKPCQD
jgi:hypothetical protein